MRLKEFYKTWLGWRRRRQQGGVVGEGANAGDFARLMLQLTQKDLEAMRRHRSLSCDSHQRSDWRLLRCLYQCTPVGLGWVVEGET